MQVECGQCKRWGRPFTSNSEDDLLEHLIVTHSTRARHLLQHLLQLDEVDISLADVLEPREE